MGGSTMRNYIAACLVLLLLASGIPAQGLEERGEGNTPVYSYELDFALDTENKQLTGTQTITVINYSAQDWTSLCLRDYATVAKLAAPKRGYNAQGIYTELLPDKTSSELSDIQNLTTGQTLTYIRKEADPSVIYLLLDEPLPSGESYTITFTYQAQLFYGRGNLGWYIQEGTTLFQLGNFYPILTCFEDGKWSAYPNTREGEYFYSPISQYTVSLTVPKGMTVAASTPATSVQELQAQSRWSFRSEPLRDFALFASDGYQVAEDTQGEVTVRAYFPTGYEDRGLEAIQTARQALEVFGEAFGYSYPYDTFTLVYGASYGGGMEFPALALLSLTSTEDDLVHEVAHQWFYAIVGSNSGQDPWLDETLATYCQLLYTARTAPGTLEQELIQLESMAQVPDHSLAKDAASLGGDYTSTVYWYGALFLYRLEQAMGESFFAAMEEYIQQFAMEQAATSDWVRIVLRWARGNEEARALLEECLFPWFGDVEGEPCAQAAPLLAAYGLMEGTGEEMFSPGDAVTRAQAVTILYRLAGAPDVAWKGSFDDVSESAWYAQAVAWAVEREITTGVGADQFAPQRPITQREWNVLLARYWGEAAWTDWQDDAVLTRGALACLLEQSLTEHQLI